LISNQFEKCPPFYLFGGKVLYGINISKVLHTAKMKSFPEFCKEAYDASFMSGAQIVRTGEGGRTGRIRRKTKPERTKRGKALGGGEFADPKPYKDRKDIGIKKGSQYQEPTQPRGSAALSPKESAKKAYLEKKEREAGKKTPTANELLSKAKSKPPKPAPGYTPHKQSDYSEKERKALYKKGERALRDVVLDATGKKSEKELKHKYTSK
jgi:hypothetical protein